MERLTFEVHDGGMFVKESDVKTFDVEDEAMHTGNAIRKLAEYEDLEEQGKLLKLPCAVGDKVYKIWSCGKNGKTIAEFIVSHIDIDYLPDIEFSYRKENGHGNYYFSKIEDIDKTVFLTKSSAEQALKEMEGKNGD